MDCRKHPYGRHSGCCRVRLCRQRFGSVLGQGHAEGFGVVGGITALLVATWVAITGLLLNSVLYQTLFTVYAVGVIVIGVLQLSSYRQGSAQAGTPQEGRFGREEGASSSRASWFHVRRDPEEGPLDLLLPYRDVLHCLVRNRRHRLLDGVLHLVRHGGHHGRAPFERVHVFGGRA